LLFSTIKGVGLPPSQLTARARKRADARAPAFRSAGFWTTDPVDLLADAARNYGERAAVATRTDNVNYAELDAAVTRNAAQMVAAGIQPDEPILIVVENTLDSLIAIHAVFRSGGLALLMTASAGVAHLRDVVQQTSPRFGVASSEWRTEHLSLASDPVEWLRLSRDEAVASDTPEYRAADPDRPALVIFTSGTTSKPKGVIHSLNTIRTASRNYIEAASLTGDDRLFLVSPMASVTGVLQAITVPPLLGAQVVLEQKWHPARSYDFLLASRGTFFGGTDLLLNELLNEAEARGHSQVPIRSVFLGGAMLDPQILMRIEEQFGITVMPAYGSSEAPISTSGMRDEPRAVRLADDGRPLSGVDIKIGSVTDGQECCIGGPHLFLGYADAEDDEVAFENSREAYGSDWFATGDLASFDEGRLNIVGRIKDIVVRKGMKIPIAEVEAMMASIPEVRQAAGFSVADPETGEHLAIAIRLAAGSEFTFENSCAILLRNGLAKWKLPEEIVIWEKAFPETATGKVQRTQLAEMSLKMHRQVAPRIQEPSGR
jgi:acyl-CoA synthetase (AMP-forming)/AMP-acid ligase II